MYACEIFQSSLKVEFVLRPILLVILQMLLPWCGLRRADPISAYTFWQVMDPD